MVFDNAEDSTIMRKIGLNIGALTGLMLLLIVAAMMIG